MNRENKELLNSRARNLNVRLIPGKFDIIPDSFDSDKKINNAIETELTESIQHMHRVVKVSFKKRGDSNNRSLTFKKERLMLRIKTMRNTCLLHFVRLVLFGLHYIFMLIK